MEQQRHKRILIIGSSGAGKSTLARKLAQKWHLPVVHLDALFWNAGWIPTPKVEFRENLKQQLEREEWIIDGNFGSTLEMRAKYADLIIFLDFPKITCTYRILKRAWMFRGKNRPDMASGCDEKIDIKFAKWVWRFPKDARPGILNVLRETKHVDICILRNSKEVKAFLTTAPSL